MILKRPVLKRKYAKTANFKNVLYGRNALETGLCTEKMFSKQSVLAGTLMVKWHVLYARNAL